MATSCETRSVIGEHNIVNKRTTESELSKETKFFMKKKRRGEISPAKSDEEPKFPLDRASPLVKRGIKQMMKHEPSLITG